MLNNEQVRILELIAMNETINLSLWNRNVNDKNFLLSLLEKVNTPAYKAIYGSDRNIKTFIKKTPDNITFDEDVFKEIVKLGIYRTIFEIDENILNKVKLNKNNLLDMANWVKDFKEDLAHEGLTFLKNNKDFYDELLIKNYLKYPVNINKEMWENKDNVSYLKKLMLNPDFKSNVENKVPFSFLKELLNIRNDIKNNLNLIVFLEKDDELGIKDFTEYLLNNNIGNIFLSLGENFKNWESNNWIKDNNMIIKIVENDIDEYEVLSRELKGNKDLILTMAKISKDPRQIYLSNVNTIMAEDNQFMEQLLLNVAENSDFLLNVKNGVLNNLQNYINLHVNGGNNSINAYAISFIETKQKTTLGDNYGYVFARNEKLMPILKKCGYVSKEKWNEMISSNPGFYREAASYLESLIMSESLKSMNKRKTAKKF